MDSSGFSSILSEFNLFSYILSYSVEFSRILLDSSRLFRILSKFGQILSYSLWIFQIFRDSLTFFRILSFLADSSGFSSNLPDLIRILSCSLVFFVFFRIFPDPDFF